MKFAAFLIFALSVFVSNASAKELVYNLKPQKVAEDIYAFIGSTEHFNRQNGGNIVNTGFIIGESGVIVIDTGPSARYGREMLAAIRSFTPKPITHVLLTHLHPDHIFGNQAFLGSQILALPETVEDINVEGEGLLENMYQMVGDWMVGTELVKPTGTINSSKANYGGRDLRFFSMMGHSHGDLAILDEKSGVLFTGDLVFYNRTPTTPHASIKDWKLALEALASYEAKILVPGHGPVDRENKAIDQTMDYLTWLEETLLDAAVNGLEMTEVMRLDLPERFDVYGVDKFEFHRSVAHLWPSIVEQSLPLLD